MTTVYVVEAPRKGRHLFEGLGYSSVRDAIAFVEGETAPAMVRLALWISEPPPDSGPDAAVCVPLRIFTDVEARAAEVVAGWERTWALIDSMPRAHREAARDDLRGAVAAALISAAVTGVEDTALDDDF